MFKRFLYRIYPTKKQRHTLDAMLEECRWVYNETLAYRKQAWEERKEQVSLYDTIKLLPIWKQERPSLAIVFSQVLQDVQMRVDLGIKDFVRRIKAGDKAGYPRFKGKERYDSLTYTQFGFSLSDERLRLSKVGNVKIKLHRQPSNTIKHVTIRRSATGKWYATLACEVEVSPLPASDKIVGIDVGLKSFATLSNGDKVPNPRFYRRAAKVLSKAQSRMSKAAKGTAERARRRRAFAHIHERIANRRKDFAHQLSRQWANKYGVMVFERFPVHALMKTAGLTTSIKDAAWGQLIRYTTYKAEDAGRRVVFVDPRNTSKMCSRCGSLVEKAMNQRIHSCPHCGLELDRDLNAAINILRRGLASQGESPGKPSSIGNSHKSTTQDSSKESQPHPAS